MVERGKYFEGVAQFMFEEGQKMQKMATYQTEQDSSRLELTWSGAFNAVWANTFTGKQIFAFREWGECHRIEKAWLKTQA